MPAASFGHVWLLTPFIVAPYCRGMTNTEYQNEYDGILKTLQLYIDGSKQGKSELMRPAFQPHASFFGYAGEQLASGTQFLFDWIDKNGPAPNSKLAGANARVSDVFTLLKCDGE